MKIKLTWKLWLLAIVLALSLLSIFGTSLAFFEKGVVINSVDSNSTEFEQGLRQGQLIISIDGKQVKTVEDYAKIISEKFVSNESVKTEISTKNSQFALYSNAPPKIIVSDISKTNLKLGLDLSGGARAIVKAQDFSLSSDQSKELADVIKNRLNVYGLEDIKVNAISDLSGNNYISIEIAGATPEDLENLILSIAMFQGMLIFYLQEFFQK